MKKGGDTFLDHAFRRWEVITVGDDFYDCQFVEFLDGYIPNTPKFNTFKFDNELFTSSGNKRTKRTSSK